MKISNSKKQLAKIIYENGGWRDGAELAAQDKDGEVFGYCQKPRMGDSREVWGGDGCTGPWAAHVDTVRNWHQTILSRDEYFHLYPAPDAEGEQKAEIRWVRGKEIYATPTAHDCMKMLKEKWGSTQCGCDECLAFYSKPAAPAELSIEQLAADYRNRKDYADRKQQEADAAKADAEAKLAELVAAGRALGLVLSVVGVAPEPELVVTDWRDLRVGDIVWWSGDSKFSQGEYRICDLEDHAHEGPFVILLDVGACRQWVDIAEEQWCFIRRPAKGGADA